MGFRRASDKDEIARLGFIPCDEQASFEDEVGVVAIEEAREGIDRRQFADAGIGIDEPFGLGFCPGLGGA